jgi:hypothetical protein
MWQKPRRKGHNLYASNDGAALESFFDGASPFLNIRGRLTQGYGQRLPRAYNERLG